MHYDSKKGRNGAGKRSVHRLGAAFLGALAALILGLTGPVIFPSVAQAASAASAKTKNPAATKIPKRQSKSSARADRSSGVARKKTEVEAKAPKTQPVFHTVRTGDTLARIAGKTGLSVSELKRKNRLKSNQLMPGQKLIVGEATVQGNGKGRHSASTAGALTEQKSGSNKGASAEKSRNKHAVTYSTKKGDNIAAIAKKHGIKAASLRKMNPKLPRRLKPGTVLVVGYLSPGEGAGIANAQQLPEAGPGFRAPRRERVWGTPTAVQAIQKACADVARRYPGSKPVFVGDISYQRGGYMPPHKSHRTGRDADISYYRAGNTGDRFDAVSPTDLDAEKTWSLFQAFLDSGRVEAIYVDYRLQKPLYEEARRRGLPTAELRRIFEYPEPRGASKGKIISHERGHNDHFHIRFLPEPRGDQS